MIDSVFAIFEELRRTFRLVDAIDILLVSAFLYAALLWFRQTASRGVLIGVAALGLVYFLARSLDMYLTSLAFHATFAVLLFILVVVFQEDLRRLLERVSSFQSVHFKRNQATIEIDVLVASVFKMAAAKTGALIVIKGREPLTRHLHGGVKLDGTLNVPLMFSIFDSSSPGHDGAMIIDGDCVTQFAAHLPISQNIQQIGGRGTRHGAALGLSEVSDALTIVVSEERGSVCVAKAGVLTTMPTATSLKHEVEDFLASAFPVDTQSLWQQILIQHALLKVLALLLAIIAWFVLAYDPHTIQRTFVVPIEYRNLAKQMELDESAPDECRVTLSGSERDFRFLDPSSMKVTLDLTNVATGYHEMPLSEQNIRLPPNLFPYRIDPRILRLTMRVKKPKPPDADVTSGTVTQ